MTEASKGPMLSRTAATSPIGKLTEDLKTKVDPDTEQAFRRICAEAGTDAAHALRNYVCKVVHGKTFDELSFEASQRRRLLLDGEGLSGALLGAREAA
jgi:uncharacterized protein with von Willebrand factor type A (vWA) domain